MCVPSRMAGEASGMSNNLHSLRDCILEKLLFRSSFGFHFSGNFRRELLLGLQDSNASIHEKKVIRARREKWIKHLTRKRNLCLRFQNGKSNRPGSSANCLLESLLCIERTSSPLDYALCAHFAPFHRCRRRRA